MKFKSVIHAAVGVLVIVLAAQPAGAQGLLTQTTWGGTGSDVASGVAMAADGSSYVVGITDSFALDQFGSPSPRIFLVKFGTNGSVAWQRIWNGQTVRGLGRPAVAAASDGSVYVTGVSVVNGNDAAVLKFDAAGTLLWERTWGGSALEESSAIAAAADGSVYITGRSESFTPSGMFVVKFNAAGSVVWQVIADGAGSAVTASADGSVYAAGTLARDQIGDFDLLTLKITPAGGLVWARTYTSGSVADARGGIAASPDGAVVIAGAIQTVKNLTPDITAAIVKIDAAGNLVFDRQFDGRINETGDGVAVDQADASIYVAGTTTSFGAGSEDAYVLHLQSSGKKLLNALTWGGPAQEEGAGVAVVGSTVALAATTNAAGPYVLQPAAARVSAPKSALAALPGTFGLTAIAGVLANPAAGTTTPAGSTVFSGSFETALIRIAK